MSDALLIAVVGSLSAIVSAVTVRFLDRILTKSKTKAEAESAKADATKQVTDAAMLVVQEVQEECAGLRAMLIEMHSRVEKVESENKSLKQELSETKVELLETKKELNLTKDSLEKTDTQLNVAKSNLDVALEWMNEYTPALTAAGIEPFDVKELKLRGGE